MIDEIPAPMKYSQDIKYNIGDTQITFSLQPFSFQPYTSVPFIDKL